MYSIALLPPHLRDFLVHLTARNKNRDIATTIAIAKALSKSVPVPSSPVMSVDALYTQQAYGVNSAALDLLNSIIPVDHALAQDIAKSFFRYAYDTVHGGLGYTEGRMTSQGVESFFGLDKHFSPEVIDVIKHNSGHIETMVCSFCAIFTAMRGGN